MTQLAAQPPDAAVQDLPTSTGTSVWLTPLWATTFQRASITDDESLITLGQRDPWAIVSLLGTLRERGFTLDVATLMAHPRLCSLIAELDRRQPQPPSGRLPGAPPVIQPPASFEGPSVPFRYVAGSDEAATAVPGARLDAATADALATCASAVGVEVEALIHAAFSLALSRCCGQPTVLFSSHQAGRWQWVSADLIANNGLALITAFAAQLAASRQPGQRDPAAAARSGSQFNPVVGLIVQAAALTGRPSASAAAAATPAATPAAAAAAVAPAVIVSAVESWDGWHLSARGAVSTQPQRLLDYLVAALTALARLAARAPGDDAAPAIAIDVMPVVEQALVAGFIHGPQRPYPDGRIMTAWFERLALARPDAAALLFDDDMVSYGSLNRRANRLASFLRRRGADRGSRIGLCVARSIEMVVCQLATLKIGAAYVPLDPSFPAERLAFMAEDAQLALLVTDAASAAVLTWPQARTIELDRDRDSIDACSDANPAVKPEPDDAAYVIYTSGSTGKPKGVVVTQGNVASFIAAVQTRPGLQPSDRLLAVTTLSFDIHVLELLAPLCSGACIVLADAQQTTSGLALQALINRHQITILQATPSTWNLLIDADWPGKPDLKALIGGEPLTPEMASQLLPRTGALWNMYGPTEATVWSHCALIVDARSEITIGTPLANYSGRVVDPVGRSCPVGVPGELWIGGDDVAAGYWHRPELTRERFVNDPEPGLAGASAEPARAYRTGDLVVWLADGSIRHLGRMDHQVKVRGHRIELGEIEAAIESHPDVAQCVCVVRPDPSGEARIVAYARCRRPLDGAVLQRHVGQSLPDYMVPQHIVALGQVPLLPNGKVNRNALPEPIWAVRATTAGEAPRGPVEEALARIWSEVLKVESIGRDDDFFDLGGHSLAAMRALSRIEKEFGRKLRLVSLFEAPTLQAQARLIDAAAQPESSEVSAVVPIHPGGSRPPIFFVSGYGGPILLLEKLARELGHDQPLFLLDFASLAGDGETATIEAAASALIGQMRMRQPEGPYHLAGYSLGGPIVYEMGQQLLAAGQAVPMLAMLDRFAPGHPHRPGLLRRLGLHLRAATGGGLAGELRYFRYLGHRMLRRLAVRAGLPISPLMPDEDVEVAGLNLDPATIQLGKASDRYVFRPYDGPLLFLRVQDLSDRGIGTVETDPVGGWLELAPAAQPIGVVPGKHTTLLFPENSRQLARLLRRCMAIAMDEGVTGQHPGAGMPRRPSDGEGSSPDTSREASPRLPRVA